MNDPAHAILDGLSVVGMHRLLLVATLLVMFTSLSVVYAILRWIFEDSCSGEEYIALSLGGWLLPASLASLLWYAGARIVSLQFGVLVGVVLPVLAGIALFTQIPKGKSATSRGAAVALVLLAALFLFLRLAYVSRAVVPLYFDSAQHYQFIQQLITSLQTPGAWIGSFTGYYHLGFHVFAMFLTFLTDAEVTDIMLVLGQVILTLMPFSIFFIVRHWTKSNSAAFLALVLAAFGWYMPAHAVDWGKYPALASLALLPFVVSLTYVSIQNRSSLSKGKYRSLIFLVAAGILISIFFHSRSLVVYVLLLLAWLATTAWSRITKRAQIFVIGLLVLVTLGGMMLIPSRGILLLLIDAYGRSAIFITGFVLVLSIFAYWFHPEFVFFCILSSSLFLVSLFIPLGNIIDGYANTTLLDRPYVQILLYLPLTLLAGFGLAGLEQVLSGRKTGWGDFKWAPGKVIGGVLIALVAVNAFFKYDLYPSDCCDIVSPDDLAAIHWIRENLPGEARILTASTDLNVLPTDQYQGSAGGDAGTWIEPLTGRSVVLLPFTIDFSQRQTLEEICTLNVGYVYVGKTGWFFNDSGMRVQPEGYRLLLELPKASVYEITGCE